MLVGLICMYIASVMNVIDPAILAKISEDLGEPMVGIGDIARSQTIFRERGN